MVTVLNEAGKHIVEDGFVASLIVAELEESKWTFEVKS